MTKEEVKKEIERLVARFREHREEYHLPEYNETKTRRDFVDPFFKALGWDIDNSDDAAEAYREVIHEDKVKVGGRMKAPDYGFRLQGSTDKRLFYVEAKKPSVLLKVNREASFQIRRYGLSAQAPVSILTNFEEFVVYDCSRKPDFNDSASVAKLRYFTFEQYLDEFDFIYDTFSREAVVKGRFDKFVKSDTYKKGSQTLDKYFVETLNGWRTYIATSIARNNLQLTEDDINFVVQLTIDRLIFLRFCEDRGVEQYGQLQEAIKSGDVYKNLFDIFKQADEKYNSGLFDFEKDKISHSLKLDNKVLKTIVGEMYYPKSSYDFRIMPVEIIGNAYEQFLGKIIRITKAHHAVIEEKPEVRKAGGVYYTPQYIVSYIVENTVGKLVEGKSPKEIEKIKIVDPACGSGSFLIGAFQFLLNYHIKWYSDKGYLNKKAKDNPLTPTGTLTSAEKKKILLNNIYGVDIDTNAVEVTKLSLLLKCMEGETEASIKQQLSLMHERVLPDLDNNIKSGNSLIDTDFYDSEFELGFEKKIKPFNWQKGFSEVFKQGGFDAVIGNPPYLGGREWKEENGNAYEYFIKKYKVAEYQFDIYTLFWEAGIELLNEEGVIGLITPNTWLNNQSNKKLRTFILENSFIQNIVDYSKVKVFEQVTVLPIVSILQKVDSKNKLTNILIPTQIGFEIKNTVNQNIWKDGGLNIINIDLNADDLILRGKIEKHSDPLEKLARIKFGIKIYETGKGKPVQKDYFAKKKIYESDKKIDKTYRPYLEGKDINPYKIEYKNRWLKYGENLAAPRDSTLFEGERILVRRIVGKTLISAYTNVDYVTSQLLQIVKPYDQSITKILLGILNSKLLAYYFRKEYNRQDKTFPEIRIYELGSLPIKQFDKSNFALCNDIVKHVDILLKLNEELKEAKLPEKIDQLKTRIGYSEDKINQLVYELYGLTEEEIKIIENG